MQSLINGLCLAWIYILIALGLTLILSIMRVLQFAHGEVYMIGAYTVYYFTVIHGLNYFLAIFISMILIAALALLLEKFLFRPLQDTFLPCICAATGLMLILQTTAVLGFGLSVKHLPNLWPGVFEIFGLVVPKDRLAAVLVSLTLTFLLYLLLKRSKYGQAMIAVAQDREGAMLQGINPNFMSAAAMATGSALAAVGGALAGGIFLLGPFMGADALTKGICIIILGGMGSLLGAVVAGLILGLTDGLIPVAFGPAPAVLIPMIVIILVLVTKPQGLFGHE